MRFIISLGLLLSGCGFIDGAFAGQSCNEDAQCDEADDCLPCDRLCSRGQVCADPAETFDECGFGEEETGGSDDLYLDAVDVSREGNAHIFELTLIDLDDDIALDEDNLRLISRERAGDDAPDDVRIGDDERFEAGDATEGEGREFSTITLTLIPPEGIFPPDRDIMLAVSDGDRRSNGVCIVEDGEVLDE